MTLNPFVMGSAKKIGCFDEDPPCTLEQTSMCVISVTQKQDPQSKFPGQDKYVPWLVCMDSSKDKITECHEKAGVDAAAVSRCMSSDAPQLVEQYLQIDKHIGQTPTVHINGKNLKSLSYRSISKAICGADPSLKGCSSDTQMPEWADWEPSVEQLPKVHSEVVV
mmetsp:Transcript_160934/g.283605  ORF Transcript_160934/g.283605 Transcript_160934/m.283605 type:complete len:165 (-) Transcript_160934:254-748(-)